ncbi:MAG: hypothetical protein IT290_06320 [Deltaproteobacteria bacterium]|nr:hypothetical protein [Deltaproteobacteria bacterium]
MFPDRPLRPSAESTSLESDSTSLQRLSLPRPAGASSREEQSSQMLPVQARSSIRLSDIPADEIRTLLLEKGVLTVLLGKVADGDALSLVELDRMSGQELVATIERLQRDLRSPRDAQRLKWFVEEISEPNFVDAVERIRAESNGPATRAFVEAGRLDAPDRLMLASDGYRAFASHLRSQLGWDTSQQVRALLQAYRDPATAEQLLSEEWRVAAMRLSTESHGLATNSYADFEAVRIFLEDRTLAKGRDVAVSAHTLSGQEFESFLKLAHEASQLATLHPGLSPTLSDVSLLVSMTPEALQAARSVSAQLYWDAVRSGPLSTSLSRERISLQRFLLEMAPRDGTSAFSLEQIAPADRDRAYRLGAEFLKLGFERGDVGELMRKPSIAQHISSLLADPDSLDFAKEVLSKWPHLRQLPATATMEGIANSRASEVEFRIVNAEIERRYGPQAAPDLDPTGAMKKVRIMDILAREDYQRVTPIMPTSWSDESKTRADFLDPSEKSESPAMRERQLEQTLRVLESPAMRVVHDQFLKRFSLTNVHLGMAESIAARNEVVDALRDPVLTGAVESIVWSVTTNREVIASHAYRIGLVLAAFHRQPEKMARRVEELREKGQINPEVGLANVLAALLE